MIVQDYPSALITANGQLQFTLNGVTGPNLNVGPIDELWFQVAAGGTPTFTIALEGSMDDSNWTTLAVLDASATAPGTLVVNFAAAAAAINKLASAPVKGIKSVRFTVSGFGSAGAAPAAFVKSSGVRY